MHDQEWQWGYYTIKSKWEYDDDSYIDDTFYVGKLLREREEYCFDRKEALFLGKYINETWTLPFKDIEGAEWEDYPYFRSGQAPSAKTRSKADAALQAYLKDRKVAQYESGTLVEWKYVDVSWDDDEEEFWVDISGYEILADELYNLRWERGQYRWVQASQNYSDYTDPEYIKYAVEDYERWEKLGVYWSYMYVIVTIYKDNVEIASASCGGIESDGGDEYIKELLESVTDEALHQANIGLSAEAIFKEAEKV